jgi:hypothetical protein
MIYLDFFMIGVQYGFFALGFFVVLFSVYHISVYFKTISKQYKIMRDSK